MEHEGLLPCSVHPPPPCFLPSDEYSSHFHSCSVHLDTIKVFYLLTDAQ